MSPPLERKDGGYGWFIVLAVVLSNMCTTGIARSAGIFYVFVQSQLGETTDTRVSLIFSLQRLMDVLGAFIWPGLATRFGARPIIFGSGVFAVSGLLLAAVLPVSYENYLITLGIIVGLSVSMGMLPSMMALPQYFDKRLAMASAIGMTGPALGLLFVPAAILVGDKFWGFSGSLISVAAVMLHLFVASALQRPVLAPPPAVEISLSDNMEDASEDKKKKSEKAPSLISKYCQLFKNWHYVLLLVAVFLLACALSIVYTFVIAMVKSKGYSENQQVMIVPIVGISELFGRLLWGIGMDRLTQIRPLQWLEGASLCMACTTIAFIFVDSYEAIVVINVATCLFGSGVVVTGLPLCRDLCGIDLAPLAWSFFFLIFSISMTLGIAIGGMIRDASVDYNNNFIVSAIMMLASCCVMHVVAVARHYCCASAAACCPAAPGSSCQGDVAISATAEEFDDENGSRVDGDID